MKAGHFPMLFAAAMAILASAPGLGLHDHILALDPSPVGLQHRFIHDYPGLWQTSTTDAAEAKDALYAWLRAKRPAPLDWSGNLPAQQVDPEDYALQYVGARFNSATGRFEPDGNRIVIIHAERKALLKSEDALDRSELRVSDGGHSFFDAWYDVDRAKLLMFAFHGFA